MIQWWKKEPRFGEAFGFTASLTYKNVVSPDTVIDMMATTSNSHGLLVQAMLRQFQSPHLHDCCPEASASIDLGPCFHQSNTRNLLSLSHRPKYVLVKSRHSYRSDSTWHKMGLSGTTAFKSVPVSLTRFWYWKKLRLIFPTSAKLTLRQSSGVATGIPLPLSIILQACQTASRRQVFSFCLLWSSPHWCIPFKLQLLIWARDIGLSSSSTSSLNQPLWSRSWRTCGWCSKNSEPTWSFSLGGSLICSCFWNFQSAFKGPICQQPRILPNMGASHISAILCIRVILGDQPGLLRRQHCVKHPFAAGAVQHIELGAAFLQPCRTAAQLWLFHPQLRPQHPKISASSLRTTRSAQLCSKGIAWINTSIWTIDGMFLVVSLTVASHSSQQTCLSRCWWPSTFTKGSRWPKPLDCWCWESIAASAYQLSLSTLPVSTSLQISLFSWELKPKNSLEIAGGGRGC